MNARRVWIVLLVAVLAGSVAAQEPPEEEMRDHFRVMFRETMERAEDESRMLQEERDLPELSEREREAVGELVESHREIVEMSREALEKVRGAEPHELEEMEREIRAMERELEFLWLDRELAFAMRHIQMVDDRDAQEQLEERAMDIFSELKEMAERRAELEIEKQELAEEIGAELRPRM